ncbi:MAG: single-stranded DNA-binding protein [Pirellulaceae bacterium]|nr:single-stranded DNA-binding protein [Pirellulaceae bacterium]
MIKTKSNRIGEQVLLAAGELSQACQALDFSGCAAWVYNPLQYAWQAHQQYILKYARRSCQVVFLGMNPGPWGMAQTGVPFGEVAAVTHWLKIDAPISAPDSQHPKRPVLGLKCPRSEVSGKRFWGLFSQRFDCADEFFQQHFVANYCPLAFMEQSARNLTPDKLPATSQVALQAVCDRHLARLLDVLQPQWLIGVGAWAESCGRRVIAEYGLSKIQVGRILHPSPASPLSSRDWPGTATKQLQALGVWS